MIHRLITVWEDQEGDTPIMRCARDFDTLEQLEAHITDAIKLGVVRIETTRRIMPNGGYLAAVYIPIGRVCGWYLWELPDMVEPLETGVLD